MSDLSCSSVKEAQISQGEMKVTRIISLACLSAGRTVVMSVERMTKMMAFRCTGFISIGLVRRHVQTQ